MPYSTGCKTPLSNFEAGQEYRVSFFLSFSLSFSSLCIEMYRFSLMFYLCYV